TKNNIFFFFFFEKHRAPFGLHRRETVLVDEHRLVLEPALPRELRDIVVDALADLARIRDALETFGLGTEHDAVNHPCHIPSHPIRSSSELKSAATGAGTPTRGSLPASYQCQSSRSLTTAGESPISSSHGGS